MFSMNRLLTFLAIAMLWMSCEDSSNSENTASGADSTAQVVDAQSGTMAVCLWNEAGLRAAPGKGTEAKWVTAINFGEVVYLTGNEETPEGEQRAYLEMSLKGGAKGWSSGNLFAVDARRAAAYGTIDLYKRPELTTFTGTQLEAGEIFAVKNSSTQPGWLEVMGREKKKVGWIQENSRFTSDEVDVSVAVLYTQAMAEKTNPAKEAALLKILDNSTFQSSSLIGLVEQAVEGLQSQAELPANQLYITADKLNARSAPNTTSEVLFQVNNGAIGTIVERTPELEEVNGNTDYWYLIEVEGQEGWVFGHHTSKQRGQ